LASGSNELDDCSSSPIPGIASEDNIPSEADTTGTRIVMYEAENASTVIIEESLAKQEGVSAGLSTKRPNESVLYIKQTLRSGQAMSHKGHLVIIGDVNAGAEVKAEGDITVWGTLRGVAHAGVGGNTLAEIRALKLQPIQLRIADAIARSPDPPQAVPGVVWGPESARLIEGKIRILRNNLD
jgi:septum site-determining protein MinC